jgi:very-short-patch-repair endonuclease
MSGKSRTFDEIAAELATGAHGNVTRAELLAAAVREHVIDYRLKRGSLLPVFAGVYRVGHAAPSTEADYMAAVLACGAGSLLRGLAAAHLWELIRGRGAPPPPEVVARGERLIEGLETVRCRDLDERRDGTVWRGIPVTTVARTLVDIAAVLGEDELALAFHQASVRYRTRPEDVEALLARRPRTKGAAALRRVVRGESPLLLSRMEKRFRKLLKAERIPLPVFNRPAGAHYVDCRWPEQKLTVELDSYRFHATRHAWEQDRAREREAHERGDALRRYTSADVFEDPRAMLREVRALVFRERS